MFKDWIKESERDLILEIKMKHRRLNQRIKTRFVLEKSRTDLMVINLKEFKEIWISAEYISAEKSEVRFKSCSGAKFINDPTFINLAPEQDFNRTSQSFSRLLNLLK